MLLLKKKEEKERTVVPDLGVAPYSVPVPQGERITRHLWM